jgi:hypothetical protein
MTAPLSPDVQFSIQEQTLRRNVNRFRGGLVFEDNSTLGSRVVKKKKMEGGANKMM